MKKCYVIGPYRANDAMTVSRNIQIARDAAIELWQAGFSVFCPHMNTAHFDGFCHDGVWLQGGLEWLRVSDFAVVIGHWDQSQGCKREIEECKNRAISFHFSVRKAIEVERGIPGINK